MVGGGDDIIEPHDFVTMAFLLLIMIPVQCTRCDETPVTRLLHSAPSTLLSSFQ
jgi:hypothetical protein